MRSGDVIPSARLNSDQLVLRFLKNLLHSLPFGGRDGAIFVKVDLRKTFPERPRWKFIACETAVSVLIIFGGKILERRHG